MRSTTNLTPEQVEFWYSIRLRAGAPAVGQPYLSQALLQLIPVNAPGLKTMGIDRWWRVYIDFDYFMNEKGVVYAAGVLGHEPWHNLRSHQQRFETIGIEYNKDKEPVNPNSMLWNIAGDMTINQDLINRKSSNGQKLPDIVPEDGVFPGKAPFESFVNDLTTEEYYSQLILDAPSSRCEDCEQMKKEAREARKKQQEQERKESEQSDSGDEQGDQNGSSDQQDNESGSGDEQGDENGSGDQQGDENGSGDEQGDENGSGDQQGDENGSGDQQGDENGSGDEQGDENGSGDQQGDENGSGDQQGNQSGSGGGQQGDQSGSGGGQQGMPTTCPAHSGNQQGSGSQGGVGNPMCGNGSEEMKEYELGSPETSGVEGLDNNQSERIKIAVAQEIRNSPPGSTPGSMRVWADEIFEGDPLPWQQILQGALKRVVAWKRGQLDYRRSRPHRRQYSREIIRPAMQSPKPRIGIAIDTSGSHLHKLPVVVAEIEAIVKQVGVRGNELLAFGVDTRATEPKAVKKPSEVLENMEGGGGTDMCVGFEQLEMLGKKNRIDIGILISDLESGWPTEPPRGGIRYVVCGIVDGNSSWSMRYAEQAQEAMGSWADIVLIDFDEKRKDII